MENYQNLTMQEQLAYRKKREIWKKLDALSDELDLWLERSQEKEDFEKHHTQIRAIVTHLSQWNKKVRSKIKESLRSDADPFLDSVYNAEKLILSEHRIWEYFRNKFIQRREEGFKTYLKVADEFAWSCYLPVLETIYPSHLDASRKLPPLVFFNGGTSPFSISRGKEFKPETVPGERLSGKEMKVLSRLPISVVGVPWNQIKHLPEAIVIGHEVGHIVEDDFGLTKKLEALLSEAITDAATNDPTAKGREEAWCKWLGEIFADIYGCLSVGPSFAGVLIDFLARGYGEIATEFKTKEDWGLYPTIYLRVRVVLETLEQMGFSEEANNYRKLWDTFSSKMDEGYTTDIPFIVSKLLKGMLIKSAGSDVENRSLLEIFRFDAELQAEVMKTLGRLKKGMSPGSENVRVLFASARAAYESDPKEFIKKDYGGKILKHIESKIKTGVRAREMPLTAHQLEERMKQYEKSAAEIINEFLQESDA